MTIHDDLASLYAYTRWADALVIEAARQLTPEQYVQEPAPGWASVRATLHHMAGAMSIWARRLAGETVTSRPTEEDYPTVDDAERLLGEAYDAFARQIEALTPERLETIWSYRNLKGELSRTPLWAVYRHVANHQTYHRGQLVSKLKRLGVSAPDTDLVYWAMSRTPQGED